MSQTTNHLLIVDDELHILRSLHRLVRRRFGMQVNCWVTESTHQALEWARERPFDAVVSAIRLRSTEGSRMSSPAAAQNRWRRSSRTLRCCCSPARPISRRRNAR